MRPSPVITVKVKCPFLRSRPKYCALKSRPVVSSTAPRLSALLLVPLRHWNTDSMELRHSGQPALSGRPVSAQFWVSSAKRTHSDSAVGKEAALTFQLVSSFPQRHRRSVSERQPLGVSGGRRLRRLLLQPAGSHPRQEIRLFRQHSGKPMSCVWLSS